MARTRLVVGGLVMVGVQPGLALAQGVCEERQKLIGADVRAQDTFGFGVGVDGDLLVCSSLWDDDRGLNAGSVYVFERRGGAWVEQSKLLASDGAANHNLGRSVSISGGRVIAGASGASIAGAGSGGAYVFEFADGVWTQAARLSGSSAGPNDRQGWSVAIDGAIAVVGAHRDDDRGTDSGAAYVFERDADGVWTQTAKLIGEDTSAGDEFGHAVALHAGTILVGAHEADPFGADSGAAYVFGREQGVWVQQAKLSVEETTSPGSHFGRAVAIHADRAVIGAPFEHPLNYGAAYVFERQESGWTLASKLLADVRTAQEWFASSVAIEGDRIVAGSFFNTGTEPGSVFVFDRRDGVWTLVGEAQASDGVNADGLGRAVALSGESLVAGANQDDDRGSNAGSVYVFDSACAPACAADLDDDGTLGFGDVLAFLVAFSEGLPEADIIPDGRFDAVDVNAFLVLFSIGCP